MPGFDGTGPRGMGPMTGGGRGFCNPYSPVNTGMAYRPWGYGRGAYGGRGAGMGFGRGMAWGFGAGMMQPPSREAELQLLTTQAEMLSQQLEGLRARIAELEQEAPE
ncbi:MAG: DUF5320 domain-containing protein [Armatimonadetes bacterium]|nr:DUF5320 domain-containing protein [Armatimonadota bacterium]